MSRFGPRVLIGTVQNPASTLSRSACPPARSVLSPQVEPRPSTRRTRADLDRLRRRRQRGRSPARSRHRHRHHHHISSNFCSRRRLGSFCPSILDNVSASRAVHRPVLPRRVEEAGSTSPGNILIALFRDESSDQDGYTYQ